MRRPPRPTECCTAPAPVDPLPPATREQWVALFRALGEPTRLEIFRLIADQPAPICVCDVVARFPLQQPTISHHLRVLREAGLVTATRRGPWAYYAPDPRGLERLQAAVASLASERLAAAG